MSDDLRQREPARDAGDDPAQEGLRSDHAGSSASMAAPTPPQPRTQPGADAAPTLPDRPEEPPTGQATSAGGGYGSGSDRASSGGSGDGQAPAGDDAQTNWLRTER
jgi:hypothetical protein